MDNWNSNSLFRDRDEQRQMGIQSAKDHTRYSMGNHTEEGDQLWNAHGKFLAEHFVEIATAKTDATRPVHLYRNPTTEK